MDHDELKKRFAGLTRPHVVGGAGDRHPALQSRLDPHRAAGPSTPTPALTFREHLRTVGGEIEV